MAGVFDSIMVTNSRHLFLLAVGFFLAFQMDGQISVSAKLDNNKMLIGDQIHLELIIEHASKIKLKDIDFSVLDTAKSVEVIDPGHLDTISSKDRFLLSQKLTLTSFDSGYHWVPPIPITYKEGSFEKIVETNELGFFVTTIPIKNDSIDIAPIKEIIEEPLKLEDLLPYFGGVAGIAAIIALIYYLWAGKKERIVRAPIKIERPAHEVAIDKLKSLKDAKLWQQGKIKEFQSELTFIVREYLENRFEIPALESTTEETLKMVEQNGVGQDWSNRLKDMFQVADLVKFAKAKPPVDFHDQVLGDAERFVLATKFKESEVASESKENDPS